MLSGRVVAVFALIPWLAASPALPPEHVHAAQGAHRHAIVHEHALAHDHDGTEIESGDEHVVWLDDVGIAEAMHTFAALPAVIPAHVEIAPEPIDGRAALVDEATLPHGPPRLSPPLRGPPAVAL